MRQPCDSVYVRTPPRGKERTPPHMPTRSGPPRSAARTRKCVPPTAASGGKSVRRGFQQNARESRAFCGFRARDGKVCRALKLPVLQRLGRVGSACKPDDGQGDADTQGRLRPCFLHRSGSENLEGRTATKQKKEKHVQTGRLTAARTAPEPAAETPAQHRNGGFPPPENPHPAAQSPYVRCAGSAEKDAGGRAVPAP